MNRKPLRSVFDLYSQRENRFTFALLRVLDGYEGRRPYVASFLKEFVELDLQSAKMAARHATVSAQEHASPRASGAKESLADGFIQWEERDRSCGVLIETKVDAALKPEQLRLHARQLRSYDTGIVLAVTPKRSDARITDKASRLCKTRVKHVLWRAVWAWANTELRAPSGRVPAFLLREFVSLLQEEESMTDFQGVRFVKGEYDYAQAKTILKKLGEELCQRIRGRPGVIHEFRGYTHRRRGIEDDDFGVWDVLSPNEKHTSGLHITLAIHKDGKTEVSLTLPNRPKGGLWTRLSRSIQDDSFAQDLLKRLQALRNGQQNSVFLRINQRHKEGGRKSKWSEDDGQLVFKIDTHPAFAAPRREHGVKETPVWWDALRKTLDPKRGVNRGGVNREFQIRVKWSASRAKRREFVGDALNTLRNLAPIARMLQGNGNRT